MSVTITIALPLLSLYISPSVRYSPSGNVSAAFVYANYGRPEDFDALEAVGVSVEGKIVITRYGEST